MHIPIVFTKLHLTNRFKRNLPQPRVTSLRVLYSLLSIIRKSRKNAMQLLNHSENETGVLSYELLLSRLTQQLLNINLLIYDTENLKKS